MLLPAKCPECGGFVEVDNEKKLGICQHCGQPFVVQDAIQTFNSYYNTTNNYNPTNNYNGTVVNIYENNSNDFVIKSGVLEEYNGKSVDVVIPDGVVKIGNNCFKNLNIESVVISDGVKTIGERAFFSCDKLMSITIPKSVSSIGEHAFTACRKLESVYITDIAAWCAISFGEVGANPVDYTGKLFLNGDLVVDLVIPNGVTTINHRAFYGASCIASVTIPDSVTSIGAFAFNCCPNLKTINISDRILSVGRGAFKTYWESKGLCSFCGGVFKEGLFSTKCKRCNEKKIY